MPTQRWHNYELIYFTHISTYTMTCIYAFHITCIHLQAQTETFNLLTEAEQMQEQMFTCVHWKIVSQRWQIHFILLFSDYRKNDMALIKWPDILCGSNYFNWQNRLAAQICNLLLKRAQLNTLPLSSKKLSSLFVSIPSFPYNLSTETNMLLQYKALQISYNCTDPAAK